MKIRFVFILCFFLCFIDYQPVNSQNIYKVQKKFIESVEKTVLKEAQNIITEKNKEIENLIYQKNDILKFGIFLFVIFIFLFFLAGMKFKRINNKLRDQNKEIEIQRKEIESQKNHITKKTLDLLVLNKELKENNELREGLTGMIVHDLKNPISNIISLSENREILFFAKDMLRMVENILDIQKYEGMIMPVIKKIVLLKKVATDSISQVSLYAECKNIKIKNNIPEDIYVFADEEIIIRVIVNLLTNAIKYTFNNGLIVIESKTGENNPDEVKISVTDNGIGIKEDKIPLIFDKFSQIIARKTGKARSTGIGLTFCKMAVEAHESSIKIKSIPGEFTTFEFYLPIVNSKISATKKSENPKTTKNVKISEDEKQYLQNFYEELRNLEVYEISELRKVIFEIDDISENIIKWKKEINNAIYNCNVELYDKLIQQIN